MVAVSLAMAGGAAPLVSQQVFGQTSGGAAGAAAPRAITLEQEFLRTENWTFFHDVDDLPSDMRGLLAQVAGDDVVGPGEPMDLSDMQYHSGRAQHHYTAVTDSMGLIVWFTGGGVVVAHAALYDRRERDACVYEFGRDVGPLLPLESLVRNFIGTRGAKVGGCRYLTDVG